MCTYQISERTQTSEQTSERTQVYSGGTCTYLGLFQVGARTIEIYRAMHVPTYQLAQHYFRSLMSAPLDLGFTCSFFNSCSDDFNFKMTKFFFQSGGDFSFETWWSADLSGFIVGEGENKGSALHLLCAMRRQSNLGKRKMKIEHIDNLLHFLFEEVLNSSF